MHTAVILAAGQGIRLRGITGRRPKGFLEIGGVSLIERSVRHLLAAGIRRIVIGTGHQHGHYEAFAKRYPVETVLIDRYTRSGSLNTLYGLRGRLDDGFLLLESDLLYDPEGLAALMASARPDALLTSGWTHSGDEVYVEADGQGNVAALSKKPEDLRRLDGELVGIAKLSLPTYRAVCAWASSNLEKMPLLDYESALTAVGRQIPILHLKIEDYLWCEIDDARHWARARTRVYPRLRDRGR